MIFPARLARWLALVAPREVVYWCGVRMLSEAVKAAPGSKVQRKLTAPALTFRHVLTSWR